MSWLTILGALLKLASRIAEIVRDKQLMDAGEAKAIARSLGEQNARLEKALAAGRAARSAAERSDTVPDDGHRRD